MFDYRAQTRNFYQTDYWFTRIVYSPLSLLLLPYVFPRGKRSAVFTELVEWTNCTHRSQRPFRCSSWGRSCPRRLCTGGTEMSISLERSRVVGLAADSSSWLRLESRRDSWRSGGPPLGTDTRLNSDTHGNLLELIRIDTISIMLNDGSIYDVIS